MGEQMRKALLLAESMILAEFGEVPAVITAALKEPSESSLERFNELMADYKESPLERLRFFCSLAMNGQDWLDVEQFFDALATQPQAPQGAVTDAERSEIEELRFYKRVGFPYIDHSTMFHKDHCGYMAITVPAHLPHPKGEGTVMGKVIRGYTVAEVYEKAKAHMAEIEGAAPETPEGAKP